MIITVKTIAGALIGVEMVVLLALVVGFLRFLVTSKRQDEAIRAASACARERKALRTTLCYSAAYAARLEDFIRCRHGNGQARLLDSAPPTARLIFAIDRKNWDDFERIASGHK